MSASSRRNKGDSRPCRLLSRFELRERYGGIPADRPAAEIDPDDVPKALRHLIPLAEKWGIVEHDWNPQDAMRHVPREELEEVIDSVGPHIPTDAHTLSDWLAGPESDEPESSVAYLAFVELTLAYDEAQYVLNHWDEIHGSSAQ